MTNIANRTKQHQTKRPHYKIWAIAWPMMLSSMSVPLLGMVDTALLGHLETAQFLGAVAIGSNIIGLLYWSFGFLRMGTTALVAQALGAQSKGNAQQTDIVLFRALFISLILGTIIMLITPFFINDIVSLMQASETVSPLAERYIEIRCLSAPAVFITFSISGWLIGTQQAKRALALVLITNSLNIALDFLFIVTFEMNSAGAAWATLIAEYAGLALGLYFLLQHSHIIQPSKWQKWLALSGLKQMLGLNYYLLLRTVTLMLVFNFFTAQSAAFNDTTLAANAILLQLILFSAFVMDGFSFAAEALCGESYGRKYWVEFKRYAQCCGFWMLLTSLFFAVIYWFFGQYIIAIFSNVSDVLSTAQEYSLWIVVIPVVSALAYLFDGVSIGAGRSRAMFYSMLLSTVLVFLPLWWLTQSWGNHGLWFAFCLFNFARAVSLGWFWYRESISIKNDIFLDA